MSRKFNKLYQEYMDIISDGYRAIYELVEPKIGNNSFFVKNYLKNITLITNKHPKYKKTLKIKAEILLDNSRIIQDFINTNI